MTTTATTFEEYCAIHKAQRIMEAGLGARPIENYMPVPEEPERDITVYMVGSGWRAGDFGFLDQEVAINVSLMGAVTVSYDNTISTEEDIRVTPRKVFSPEARRKHKAVLDTITKAKNHNTSIREEIAKFDGAVGKIDAELVEEWSQIEAGRRAIQRIKSTYADYLNTARGDATIAFEFLVKAFPHYEAERLREIVGS